MLAGVRNVAFGATIVMAGLFAVMLAERAVTWAERAWIALFLSPSVAPFFFDKPESWSPEPWSLIDALASDYTESLVGVALMIWLVGRMVRRVSKSITAGR